jgi:hypothetical protein
MLAIIKRKKPIETVTNAVVDGLKLGVAITGIVVNTGLELIRASFYLIFLD